MDRPERSYADVLCEEIDDLGLEPDEDLVRSVEGSHVVFRGSREPLFAYDQWRQRRRFTAEAIDRDGTILDIGCANGFYLQSVRAWSKRELDPYGIDIDAAAVAEAQKRFPEQQAHFAPLSVERIRELQSEGLPTQYDTVYWNVWDDWEFKKPEEIKAVAAVRGVVAPGGRLILGFYDRAPGRAGERIRHLERGLKRAGMKLSDRRKNPDGPEEIVWIDVPKAGASPES